MIGKLRLSARSLVLAAIAAAASSAANAQSTTPPAPLNVVGNRVEMIGVATCRSTYCVARFAQNNTGKVILVNYLSCGGNTTGGAVHTGYFGPMATSSANSFIKTAFFDSIQTIPTGTIYTSGGIEHSNSLNASPQLMLGANRYFSVTFLSSGNLINLSCLASGIFVQ